MSEDTHSPRPLKAHEIIEGYTAPDSLARASRNARTIKWIARQSAETKGELRMLYANHLNCPLDEIVSFDEPLDDETLMFVYGMFAGRIDS